jgi:hypothetical protein
LSFVSTGVYAANVPTASPEDVIREIMTARYAYPSATTGDQFAKHYDTSIPEVADEVKRAESEVANILKAARESGWDFRSSNVHVEVASVKASKTTITADVTVTADWYWGYTGLPTETPTQVYNFHELTLVKTGDSWRIVRDHNLASKVKPTTKLPTGTHVPDLAPKSDVTIQSIYFYNRTGARDYEYSHWNSPNPFYPDFSQNGGDCTNFSSQAIYLGGGYPFTWSADRASGWWYSTSSSYSWSWAFANEQAYFMRTNYGTYVSTPGTDNNLKIYQSYAKNLKLGDMMYYSWDNSTFGHSAMVTSLDTQRYPRVTYRNGGGGAPAIDAPWTLPSGTATLIRGLNMLDNVEVS